MTTFKEVAHLYLGCQMRSVLNGKYTDTDKLTGVDEDCVRIEGNVEYYPLDFKPILRSLGSIINDADNTDEEILEEICDAIGVEAHLYYQAYGDILTGLAGGDWGSLYISSLEMALIIKIMCKHSIDVFDLIPSGEAMDWNDTPTPA